MTFLSSPEFKVGVLVILVSGLIGVMSMKVAEGPGVLGGANEYHFTVDNAGGLVKKGAVKMAGIKVGIVDDIVLEGKKAKVKLALEPGVEIDENTRVVLKSDGILGDRHVELIPGVEKGAELESGSEIKTGEMGGGLDAVVSDVSQVAKSLNELMGVLNKAVNEGDESSRIGRIVKNIEVLTADIAQITGDNKDQLKDIVNRIQNIATNIDENLDAETLAGVKRSVQNIEDVTEKLNKGEGTLGRLINDEETVEELNTAITNVNKFLGGANKMETAIDFHTEFMPSGPEDATSKTYVGLMIKPGPDRFYELAIVDDPKGYRSTSVVQSTTGGNPDPVYEKVETFKNKMKFTALFGKTFYDFTIKGGMIETAGGFGFDYHLMDRRLRLSAEFFDLDDVYIRAFARYDVFKGIYVIAGGDNLAGANDDDALAFFGAGLFITNDDLMALVGKVSF